MKLRLIQWNVRLGGDCSTKVAAIKRYLDTSDAHMNVVVLQEVIPDHEPAYRALFQAGNSGCSLSLRAPSPLEGKNRALGVMIGVDGGSIETVSLVDRAPYPDRTLVVQVKFEGSVYRFIGAHSLTGVGYKRAKSDQFLAIAEYLNDAQTGRLPTLMALDANEPEVDAAELADSQFFNNGDKGRGASTLIGPLATHGLQDVLRTMMAQVPNKADQIRADANSHALVTSYRTRSRECRYDQVWASDEWQVVEVDYAYHEGLAAGSDHAMVVVDLAVEST